ncbi:MAG: hypothetical protein WC509_08645 [Candidatus Izemoplasmatales bacterium]
MKALWHDGDYYLLPEGNDPDVFLKTADLMRPVALAKLKQEHACAPVFREGADEAASVLLDDLCATVEVEVLPSETFERKLSEAEKKCQGCRWKGGAHDRGMERCPALDMLDHCPLYERGFDPGFLFYSSAFWRRLRGILPKLSELAARGRFQRFAREVDRLRFSIPDVFVGAGMKEDKPVLMFSGGGNDFLHLVAQYLAYTAPSDFTERIDVLSSFPKGLYKRLDEGKADRIDRRPPEVLFQPVRIDRPRFDLSILVPDASKDSAPDDAFLYLCEKMGEHKLMGAMNSIRFVDDSGFDLDYHEKAIDVDDPAYHRVSVKAYENIVDEAYSREADRSGLDSPQCFYEYFDLSEEDPVGELADVKVVHTCFMELDEDLLYWEATVIRDVFSAGVGIGRIILDAAPDAGSGKDLANRFDALLNRRLHFAGGSVPYSIMLCERRTVFHFLILDKRIVRNAVRGLAPILMKYRATYSERFRDGEKTVSAGFAMDF